MPRRAWYIGCTEDEIGEAAILVGDRARIDRIAGHLEKPAFVVENRGLRTVTGFRSGKRVTASAFGMGGPIAAIVLHELFDLGVRTFLRIGTAMVMPPAEVGDFVVADGAFRGEGASRTYAPLGYPAVPDFDLGITLRAALAKRGHRWRAGVFGTYDGFYTEMFALSSGDRHVVEADARRSAPPRSDRYRHGDRDDPDHRPNARRACGEPLFRHRRWPYSGEDRRLRTCRARARVVRDRARRARRPPSN